MLLRCAESLVVDDPVKLAIVRDLSLYRKYNRLTNGNIDEGDAAPPLARALHKWDFKTQVKSHYYKELRNQQRKCVY